MTWIIAMRLNASSTNILGNRDGEVLDDPESFKTKEESKLGVLEHILQSQLYPELYRDAYHKVRINYYPSRGDEKEGWDNLVSAPFRHGYHKRGQVCCF